MLDDHEKFLSQKLRDMCNEKGEELEPKQTAKVLHSLGKVYRQRSPNKLDLIRSVILFNAALVRNSDNKEEIGRDLKEVCDHVFELSKKKCTNTDLINAASSLKQKIQGYRSKVIQSLESNDFSENIQKNVRAIESLQNEIYDWYCNLMKTVINICQKICGDAPCQYAVIGMGSLARKEITPYSDFEHAILLEEGVQYREDYNEILEYFRWISVFSNILLINLGETIVKNAALPYLNNPLNKRLNWYYDKRTTKGISFDGMSCQASKYPLGQPGTPQRPQVVELIKPISKMLDYLSSSNELKDGYHLADVLMCSCFVSGDKNLHTNFQQRTKIITEKKCSKEMLTTQLTEDIETYNAISRLSRASLEKAVDVKRVVYRSVTLFISAVARFNNIFENSSFAKIRKLAEFPNPVFDMEFAHDLQFAVAVACYVRLVIYMEKRGQEDLHYSDDDSQQLIDHMNQLMGEETPMKFFTVVMKLQRMVCNDIGTSNANFVQWSPELDRLLACFWLQNYDFILWETNRIYKMENCSETCLKTVNEILLETGNIHYEARRYKNALESFQKVHQSFTDQNVERSNNTIIYCLQFIGECLNFLGDHVKALERNEEAIEIISNETPQPSTCRELALFHQNAGVCLFHMDKLKEAITKFEIAKDIRNEIDDPVAAISANWLGDCFFRLSKYKDALEKYQEAIKKDSNWGMTQNLIQCWLYFITILGFVYFIWRNL